MKVSEVFRQAIRDKTRQLKGRFLDHYGGYCALGLFYYKNVRRIKWSDVDRFERLLPRPMMDLNDKEGWTWEDFAQFAENHGL